MKKKQVKLKLPAGLRCVYCNVRKAYYIYCGMTLCETHYKVKDEQVRASDKRVLEILKDEKPAKVEDGEPKVGFFKRFFKKK